MRITTNAERNDQFLRALGLDPKTVDTSSRRPEDYEPIAIGYVGEPPPSQQDWQNWKEANEIKIHGDKLDINFLLSSLDGNTLWEKGFPETGTEDLSPPKARTQPRIKGTPPGELRTQPWIKGTPPGELRTQPWIKGTPPGEVTML